MASIDVIREEADMSVKKSHGALKASAIIALGGGFPQYEGDVDLNEIGQWILEESDDGKLKNVTFSLVRQTCQGKLGGSQVALRLEYYLWGGNPRLRGKFFDFVEAMMGRLNQSCALVQIGGDVYRIEL